MRERKRAREIARTGADDGCDHSRGVYFSRGHAEKTADVRALLEFGKREERGRYLAR